MAVIHSSKIVELAQAKDPKSALIKAFDISNWEDLTGDKVLVAMYIRPEKTAGGIIRPESNIKEDEFQGNAGLVLKVGPAFSEEEEKDMIHKWVVFGYLDGKRIRQDGVPGRIISASCILGTVKDPSKVL